MEVVVFEDIETFPLFLELGKMFHDIITIHCALSKKGTLDSNGNLVIFGLMYSLETFPDFVSCVEMSDMYHLILGNVIGD